LVVGPDGDAGPVAAALRAALGDAHGSVVDVSAHRAVLELAGPRARQVLEQGCSIDLHPRAFGPGRCAQTLLARAQVLLWQTAEGPTYLLLVRGSFAGYLADWLVDALGEYAAPQPYR
ncbi:MAG: sarcosine oxidase subunit gamma, partial [Streptomycetales bacterium]